MSDEQNNKPNTDEPTEDSQSGSEASCKQCSEYKAGWKRAVADYHNLQKEVSRQRSDWAAMSELSVIEDFLPVYSNFKKAFVAVHEETSWVKGIGFIMKQFQDVLKNHGIEEVRTVGEVFDAGHHEAVGEEISDMPGQTIVREVEAGYTMRGKVVRWQRWLWRNQDPNL